MRNKIFIPLIMALCFSLIGFQAINAATYTQPLYGSYQLVPTADGTDNVVQRDVIGNKTDTAAAGVVSEVESLMAYAKQLITDDLRSNGQNGLTWYVDANIAESGAGTDWSTSFKTMGEAFAVIGSGDTIRFRGKILEQLTTPAQVFDVTVIGEGNRPRHADSTPAGGEEAANSWTEPVTEAETTPLVKVQQQGWRFENILFYGGDDNSCIQFFRDGGSGDDERDGSHGEVIGCRFASGYDGIEDSGGTSNVLIQDCAIASMTNYAIKHTTGAGIGNLLDWRIKDNDFYLNANWMGTWGSNGAIITGNSVMNTTTLLIDTSAGTRNVIVGNVFNIAADSFDPTGNVTGDATDVWSNTLLDAIETGLPAD